MFFFVQLDQLRFFACFSEPVRYSKYGNTSIVYPGVKQHNGQEPQKRQASLDPVGDIDLLRISKIL